jgi:hypothetical protein
MEDILEIRLDKTKISFSDSFDNTEEREYWWSRTPEERLLQVERLRRIAYGYDEDSQGLQRVLEIVERK